MQAIHASMQAQRVSKVVLALQAQGGFQGLTLAEVRRIGPDAASGIGGIADRLMDPTPYVKLELLCSDEAAPRLVEAIRRQIDADEAGTNLYMHSVVAPERSTK